MNQFKGKRVLIFQQRDWAKRVGHFLALHLQEEGCKLAALTFKKTTHKSIMEQTEVEYAQVVNIDDVFEHPEKYLGDEDISLKEICRELGIDSIWSLIYSNRLLIRSYGKKYYYSYHQNVSDEFMVSYFKAHYKVVRDLINSFKPDLIIIAAFVYEGHVLLGKLGNKYGIPTVSIADSKVPGYNLFVHDYMAKSEQMIGRVTQLNSGKMQSVNHERAQKFIGEFREKFKQPANTQNFDEKFSFLKKIRRELSPYKQILNYYTKPTINTIKTVDPTVDNRPPRIILRNHYCQKMYARFARNYSYYPFEKVGKFVFFPLQFTPEATADLICPLFNNQVEIARQIAMSLPDDYTLVVKEHPAMVGLRTPEYLENVACTANVKLIDYRIPIDEVLKKSDMVVANFSTILFEAAVYQKPAIMLSGYGLFRLLPNVIEHTDMATMTLAIKKALVLDTHNAEYERRLENYIAAVFDVGFNFNYGKAWERGGGNLETLWQLYKKEIERVLALKNN